MLGSIVIKTHTKPLYVVFEKEMIRKEKMIQKKT